MGEVLKITYASSVTDMQSVNTSFEKGILKVAYTNANRNGSYISKETFERSMPTIYNCPVVCNYIREKDDFGGHDMELVHSEDGDLKLINVTTPVGVVPESAKYEWVLEGDKEYLCVDVLIWKRQEAYAKIKDNGITSESMEITVNNGHKDNISGLYVIDDFEFTAFCLLGDDVEPCYEEASLHLFTADIFKEQMKEMMQDLKNTFSKSDASTEVNAITQENMTEGGDKALEEKMELISKYGINVEELDFSIEDFTVEELIEKFEAMSAEDDLAHEPEVQTGFALNSDIMNELVRSLECEKINTEWGECTRYSFVDFDIDLGEVYCWDRQDALLYGFNYTMNGDNVVIDFACKKRKKCAIVDFDEGEKLDPFAGMFEAIDKQTKASFELEEKFNAASDTIASMEAELKELRAFKSATDDAIAKGVREDIFAQFTDLDGVEAFEALKENCLDYSAEDLEEKCFAIRGRHQSTANFALESKTPKILVDSHTSTEKEPYGGIFVKYAIGL